MKQLKVMLLALTFVGALMPSAGARSRPAMPWAAKDAGAEEPEQRLTDARIRQILIDESIAAYSGSCPCPYSTMSNGRQCKGRSAYSRPGGAAPLCYAKDVTSEMVKAYREANPGA